VPKLSIWIAALWAMGLTTLGFFVVPMLFMHLPSPAMAGRMAAQLFSVQTAISTGCAVLLLWLLAASQKNLANPVASTLTQWVLAGALLALLLEFGVAPRILAHENLALWHGIGSAMYAAQWLCSLRVFHLLLRPS
jgi:hypothetical protein